VKNVFLVGDDLAVVDFNSALADQHRSGIFVEELTIASVAQTLAANVPGITRVKFLIDGKERDTLAGHASLKTVYEIAALSSTLKVE
jgi:spore germination protein GerM